MWLDRVYPNHLDRWDDRLFRDLALRHITRESVVLDLGAGAGIVPEANFKNLAARVIGVDVDPRVLTNPHLDEAFIANAAGFGVPSESVDVVFSSNVLEHLTEPDQVFSEVARVLKPGGVFIAKTPNKWHYMPTIARLTPLSFHRWFMKRRGRACEDTFPTVYRANCKADVTRLAKRAGLDVARIQRIEGRPEYLRFSTPTYLAGIAYERLVNSTKLLAPLRILLVAELVKPATPLPLRP